MQKMKLLLRHQPWPKGLITAATVSSVPDHQAVSFLLGKEALQCELTVHSAGFETVEMEMVPTTQCCIFASGQLLALGNRD